MKKWGNDVREEAQCQGLVKAPRAPKSQTSNLLILPTDRQMTHLMPEDTQKHKMGFKIFTTLLVHLQGQVDRS
jgi:hypothetical protein